MVEAGIALCGALVGGALVLVAQWYAQRWSYKSVFNIEPTLTEPKPKPAEIEEDERVPWTRHADE